MAFDLAFIAKLEREIESLAARLAAHAPRYFGAMDLRPATAAKLERLQHLRRKLFEQSHGG